MAAIERVLSAAIAAALLAGGGAPAQAQAYGPPPYQGDGYAAQPDPAQQIEALHRALNLTPLQESAWRVYRATADAPNTAQQRRSAAAAMFAQIDAPRRMDLVEAEMRQELADLQRQSQALKAFYARLSPQQQRIFDAKTLPPAGDQGPPSP